MRIGIMGGTFDPIHIGHLIAAEQAREQAELDEVWFMPSNMPPHKQKLTGPNAGHRLAMVQLAIRGEARFRAIDTEIRRGGTSYTVDTMTELKSAYPQHHFFMIIGADMVHILPQWHRIEHIVKLCSFIALARPGYDLAPDRLPAWLQTAVTVAAMPAVDVSSTGIRQRLAAGRSVKYLVPAPVQQYIEGNGLYGWLDA